MKTQTPGEKYFHEHQAGKKLSISQAVKANCAACMGFYADGRRDCDMMDCPLHPWMPYRDRTGEEPRQNHGDGGIALAKWRAEQCQK
jgi:hypothetical protein